MNRYNGHTWIVAIIAMILVAILTLGAFVLLAYAVSLAPMADKTIEVVLGVPAILFAAYKAMQQVFAHLTDNKESEGDEND